MTASPPRPTTRTLGGSAPASTSALAAEGTALTIVTSGESASSESALSTTTTVPPAHSGTNSSKTETSKQIEVDASTRETWSAERSRRAQATIVTALRWVSSTPFGRPVEPEVYST